VSARLSCLFVGFDGHRTFPLRAGIQLATERWGVAIAAEFVERDALLDEGHLAELLGRKWDAVFVAGLADDRYEPAARALAEATPYFFPSAPNAGSVMSLARVPGLALAEPAARPALAVAAGVLASAGYPVPPIPPVVATLLPQVAHHLPADQPQLRSLGRVLQALLNLSPDNVAIAMASLAHELDPGAVPEPGWPEVFPACGFWHPAVGVAGRWDEFRPALEAARPMPFAKGNVLLVLFSTQVTSGNHGHITAMVEALERHGLRVIPWFGALDAAGRIDDALRAQEFDLVINLSGFTLTGTHGQPNIAGDVALLQAWNCPQLNAVPLLFQSVEAWKENAAGLAPMAVAMQVAVPELEAALAPRVVAGRSTVDDRMVPVAEMVERVAAHAARLVELRRLPNAEKRLAIVLFCVPPDGSAVGTAAYLDVFASLHALLGRLRDEGYTVEVPESTVQLLETIVDAEAGAPRTGVAIADWYPAAQYVAGAPEVERIARQWGRPPGDIDTDGTALAIRGARFGNVAILIQPDNGGYSDPIGLLYSPDASPSHSFAALYDWIARSFQAHAVLHFGTHGALEFMPGKQAGLFTTDFPEALIGPLPHLYYYCMNNPAEAAIARRRSGAEIVSYLSPPVARAGLYGALAAARDALEAFRDAPADPARLEALVAAAAEAGLHQVVPPPAGGDPAPYIEALTRSLDELEATLVPLGLHVLGEGIPPGEAEGILAAAAEYPIDNDTPSLFDLVLPLVGSERAAREALENFAKLVIAGDGPPVDGVFAQLDPDVAARWYHYLRERVDLLSAASELDAIVAALSVKYIPPSPGGDPVREPTALPTGRGLVAVDPYRVPTPAAISAGERLADELLGEAIRQAGRYPESVGVVLWGLETIKARGEAIAQVLRLIGVRPRADSFGRMTAFEIIPLDELGRPRIDVLLTVSGIFRDLFLPSTELLDRAFRAVAALDEPLDQNFVRKHVLETAEELGISIDEAAARVFSARAGRYGTGVNDAVLSSRWEDAEQLADIFADSTSFAYGERVLASARPTVLRRLLRTVDVTFQNIDSTEVSLSDVDHYFEYLGGLTNAARQARGEEPVTLVADTFHRAGRVRTLREALWYETKTRLLNPKWRDALLEHGYNGVAQVATRLDNTFGWAATTSAVGDELFTEIARDYLLNEELREAMARENPLAVQRMAKRLLEASRRGLWDAPEDIIDRLEDVANLLDDRIEGVSLVTR